LGPPPEAAWFQRMTTLGIALIVIGVALVCAGLVIRPRAPPNDPAPPDEFRTILDALDQEDRRDEPTDPAAGRSN